MKVLCIHNRKFNPETKTRDGYKYTVVIGQTYNVYKVSLRVGHGPLSYLIEDRGFVSDYPSDLFTVVEHRIPYFWGYTEWKWSDDFHVQLFGYPEILEYSHYESIIIDGHENDLKIFAAAKKRTDDCFWFGNEQEVLDQLLKANDISFDTNRVLIEKRDYDKLWLKTYFLSPYDFTCSTDIKPDKTVTVSVNDGSFEGECMLLVDSNKIYGMQLFPIDANIPSKINNIKLL